MKKIGGRKQGRKGTVARSLKAGLLARLETFVRNEVYTLELDAVDAEPERVLEARDVFKALLHLADELDLLGDNGRADTWVQFMRRYYRMVDQAEAAVAAKRQVEVAEAKRPAFRLKASWCSCEDGGEFHSYPEDGKCSCGVHKHHVHCGRCGGVMQVG